MSPRIIRSSAILSLLGLFLSVFFVIPPKAYAGGTVTNCTNDTDLHAQLEGGGTVTFNCGSVPVTIPLTTIDISGSSHINITQTTTIIGGGLVTLQGDGSVRNFYVNSDTSLTLDGLTISHGRALTVTGHHAGGAVFVDDRGALTVTNSVFFDNQADFGGALRLFNGGSLFVANSSLFNNRAFFGGAIYVENQGFPAKATILNSTLYDNTASDGDGGAIRSVDVAITIANSTLSNNSAIDSPFGFFGGDGGAIGISGSGSNKALITNTTVFSNFAASNGGGVQSDSGSGSGSIKNTIIANNVAITGTNCSLAGVTSNGNNIDSGTSCSFSASGDLSNTNPLLGPLANNGGVTLTHAPLPGSPAINAADSAACAADPINNADQRGVLRPQGDLCDIGAMEATASLAIEKSTENEGGLPVRPGERITYTISVSNTSSLTVTGGLISDPVSAHTTFVPGSLQLNPPGAGVVGTTPPTLASGLVITPGQSVSVTFAATVNTPLPNQTQIVNTASVTSSEVSQAQTSTVTDTVTSAPVLTIQKSSLDVNGGTLVPGDIISYTIVVSNSGTANATGGVISDTLPVNTSFVPGSVQLNPAGAGVVGNTLPTLVSGLTITANQRITVSYAVTINTPLPNQTQIVNTASVTSSEVSEPQSSTVTDTVTSAPVLTIQKSSLDANGGELVPGDVISYTIVVGNSGTLTATGGLISDTLPTHTSFVPGSLQLNPPGAGVVGSAPPTLASGLVITPGQSVSVTFGVTLNTPLPDQTQIVNTASVTSSEVSQPKTSTVSNTVVNKKKIYLPVIQKN